MKRWTGLLAGLCCCFGSCMGVALAQEMQGPPKVLVIQREYLKPGKGGEMHERSESAFVKAMSAAKWPVHYFAAESMSGQPRVLFFTGYPSFEAWEKDNQNTAKNAVLAASLDRAMVADGDLLSSYDQSVLMLREDGSLRANVDIPHMRYFEISLFKVRAGHRREWEELVKMYKDGYEKAVPDAKWALFEVVYSGEDSGTYVVFNPMRSLTEVEQSYADEKKFMAAMGEDGMKKLGELTAACVELSRTNLFRFNPKISYPQDEWVKADPEFWKPKMVASTVKKEAAKPTGK